MNFRVHTPENRGSGSSRVAWPLSGPGLDSLGSTPQAESRGPSGTDNDQSAHEHACHKRHVGDFLRKETKV